MYKLWMFDFDNTIARLEPVVDWPGARKILEPYLRSVGAPNELFEKFPRRNLPLFDLRNLPVPITVPPVPIAATKCVTWPRVCRQISGPVVSKCASELASLLY